MRRTIRSGLIALAIVGFLDQGQALAQQLRIGLQDDPDVLDPTISRTFVGRVVFASMCDKLFDITPDLKIVPQLATGYEWSADQKSLMIKLRDGVLFQDGTKMDAAAVKYSLERHLTLPGSTRKSELTGVTGVEVVDPSIVRINLSAPFAPLLAVLSDRAGMIVSPKAAEAGAAAFASHPVCAGPFKFVERVPQDRIVLERFPDYWNKGHVKIDKVTFLPIPDSAVRLANLKSGDLDMIERVAPTDLDDIKSNPKLTTASIGELGYQGITINVANGPKSKTPIGSDERVRQAFSLAIDRQALVQVVYNGFFIADDQWTGPASPFHLDRPAPARDVAKAKALLAAAGQPHPTIHLTVPNTPTLMQTGQVIQSMAAEAGFDVQLQAMEFASALAASQKGELEALVLAWSGRTDPDGNIFSFVSCDGALNDGKYCNKEVDAALNTARTASDFAQRKAAYDKVTGITDRELPIIYLYHQKWLWALSNKLHGFTPYPDGIIRLGDVTKG
ncbi:ABC transporter substrate-binding protein [Aliidongia dinghuensis]|uniref:ABC transporter substrate-binding protein n=1 Tax=Aliidongia dinghuensis TaxID=1867774 RepID=A0A8J3E5X9_9PROT|nr:ABC transporter substrate-binding protein [Aliidongia dinghuensis]GGF36207.1 ABC transporter substrate-binding protein [Aliidongia dinghuensis]